jgi:hypothetical protein
MNRNPVAPTGKLTVPVRVWPHESEVRKGADQHSSELEGLIVVIPPSPESKEDSQSALLAERLGKMTLGDNGSNRTRGST